MFKAPCDGGVIGFQIMIFRFRISSSGRLHPLIGHKILNVGTATPLAGGVQRGVTRGLIRGAGGVGGPGNGVFLIIVDDLDRSYLDAYQAPAESLSLADMPTFDTLASEGAVFVNMTTPMLCGPAKVAFETGLPLHTHTAAT